MIERRQFLLGLAGAAIARGSLGGGRRIAVTFDDLPAARQSFPSDQLEDFTTFRKITKRLLKITKRMNIPLAGFVSEGFMPTEWTREDLETLLEDWLAGGAVLGNHTYSHLDLHDVPMEQYQADIVLGEAVLGSVLNRRSDRIRYFRHPYLHTGKQDDRRDNLKSFLSRRGYRVAPVSVDSQDWIFAEVYAWALSRGDEPRRKATADAYLDYMEALLAHCEAASAGALGREPAQVLLLHANALNFDHMERIAELIAGRGYAFVSLAQALEDPVYAEDVPSRGSWIHGWRAVRKLDAAPDPDPNRFLGILLEDYRLVSAARPDAASVVTSRIFGL